MINNVFLMFWRTYQNIYGTNTATGFALPLTATVDCPVDPALTKTETGLDPALTLSVPPQNVSLVHQTRRIHLAFQVFIHY